jgi:hypothetical protein
MIDEFSPFPVAQTFEEMREEFRKASMHHL